MKRLISLLLCALLIVPVLAEDAPDFEPIPWDIKVSPNLPNPDCYLPNNGGYHDDSIDIQINVTYWTQDLQQVDAPGEGTTTVMSARVKLTDVSQFRTGFANKYPSKQARHVNDMTKRFNAVMGIDGDYCLYHEQGIVVRNGQTLRMRPHKGRDELIVDENGDFHLITCTTQAKWDEYIAGGGTVLHAFCFGPALVLDGVPLTSLDDVTIDRQRQSQESPANGHRADWQAGIPDTDERGAGKHRPEIRRLRPYADGEPVRAVWAEQRLQPRRWLIKHDCAE